MIWLILASAHAYELSGADWSWQSGPVEDGFVINAQSFADVLDPGEVQAAWALALRVWNTESGTPLYLPDHGTTDALRFGGGDDDLNVTMYDAYDWGYGLAVARYNLVGDDMIDCDIRIYGGNLNGSITWSVDPDGAPSGEYDLTHTAVHEIGHCLGLAHSSGETAIMYPYNGSGTGWERRHLQPDDLAGVQALYGRASVDLVGELSFVDRGDGDGIGTPGEPFELGVIVRNDGDAPAIGVNVSVDGHELLVDDSPALVGDLLAGEGVDDLRFAVTVDEACATDGDRDITVRVDDAAGNTWEGALVLPLVCVEGGPGEPAGCGCASGGSGRGVWALGLLGALVRWRARLASGVTRYNEASRLKSA